MPRPIPRGTVYHSPGFALASLLRFAVTRLDDPAAVARLEEAFAAYVGRRSCVAFPLARTAVLAALKAADLPVGADILMPPITIKPMMDVVLERGLRPRFVDLALERCFFEPAALAEAVPAGGAVLATPLYGLAPDMARVEEICRARGALLIEDISHSLNASWDGRSLGCFGDVAIYSSSTIKTFDTFGGGLALTDDADLAAGLRRVRAALSPPSRRLLLARASTSLGRALASDRRLFPFTAWPLLRWARAHRPDLYRWLSGYVEPHDRALTEIPAAWTRRYAAPQGRAGLAQLPGVDAMDRRRIAVAEGLLQRLRGCSGLGLPGVEPRARDVWWQLVVRVPEPDDFIEALARQGVDAATGNLDLIAESPLYPDWRAETPRARALKHHGVFLPILPWLGERELDRIAAAVRHALR